MVKVSVIVPVYNVEKYIRRCLDSILAQTMTDWECILVDDGSPDRSGEICDEYAEKDSRFRVFHKSNGGVASARQLGMDNAQGEYIIHADPDDWVEPPMLGELYSKAKEENADVVICDFYVNTPLSERYVKQEPSKLDHLTVLEELFQHLHGSCWNKLVRRTFLKDKSVKFPQNISYSEDLVFNTRLFRNPVKISYLSAAFYHYEQHTTSIVHTYVNKKEDEGWKLMSLLKKELNNYQKIRVEASSRLAYNILVDAFKYGSYNSFSFFLRYTKYLPCLMRKSNVSLREKLFYVRACFGLYSYFKKKNDT